MKYRYNKGDAVVVKRDLKMGCNYFVESGPSRCTYNTVVDEMKEFEGKTVHISGYLDGQYLIEEDDEGWVWTDQMFQARYEYDTACVCESLL